MNAIGMATMRRGPASTDKPYLEWMSVLRLLCAIQIVGFHWLRASYKLGAFGCPGSQSPVTDYLDTGLKWQGLFLSLNAPCSTGAAATLHALLGIGFGYGWEAVNLFILISGFVLSFTFAGCVRSHDWGSWYKRRLRRILLPYYEIALPLLTLFYAVLHIRASHSRMLHRIQEKLAGQVTGSMPANYFKHIFLVDPHQRQWIANFCAPAWWFIPAILVAYLCFPLYIALFQRLGHLLFLGLALGISIVSYQLTQRGVLIENAWYFAVLNEAFSFSLGIVAGALWKDPSQKLRLEALLSRASVMVFGFVLVLGGNLLNDYHRTYSLSSAFFTTGLAIVGFRLAKFLSGIRWIRALGGVDAFRVYLIHQPFAAPLAMTLIVLNHTWATPVGLPIFLTFSFFLSYLFERADLSQGWSKWVRSSRSAEEIGPLQAQSAGR